MFFIMGISQKMKELGFSSPIECPGCGRYSSFLVFMTYTYLSLFFIPIFRWNKRYFVRSLCCGRVYEVDRENAMRILTKDNVTVDPGHLLEDDDFKH